MSISANYPDSRPSLNLNFARSLALDPRITFTRASTATHFDSLGVLRSAPAGVARFDYDPVTLAPRGLLVEEQRTNSIRNNTMQGAVAGTPGTEPTNWASSSSGSGITREIVGTGTEDGIPYVDVRYSGTPTAGNNVSVSFEQPNQIVVASGQTWTESVFVKLQAGSFSGTTTTLSLLGTEGTSGTENFQSANITSTPSALRSSRLSVTATFVSAITTRAQPRVRIGYTVGTPIDITLRIGLPQLEQGAFATSVIPTTTAEATRTADVASMLGANFSNWYNASAGTLFAEGQVITASVLGVVAAFSDGTNSNRWQLNSTSTAALQGISVASGSTTVSTSLAGISAGVAFKAAFAQAANNAAIALNGTAGTTDTTVTVPVVDRLDLGQRSSAAYFNGHLRRIAYYPVRLSNAQLQALTS